MASCDSAEKSASLSDLADVKHGSALVADKHEPKAGFRENLSKADIIILSSWSSYLLLHSYGQFA